MLITEELLALYKYDTMFFFIRSIFQYEQVFHLL